MKTALHVFMVMAACGLALSIATHCLALAGATIPGGMLVWGLHLGIFVVWIPAVMVSRQMRRETRGNDLWKDMLAGCPRWMRRAFYILVGYAVVNFIIFMAMTSGHGKRPKGDAPPEVIRGFSGHWMFFYGAAFATLYSQLHPARPRIKPESADP